MKIIYFNLPGGFMKKILMIVSAVMMLSVSAFADIGERVGALESTVTTLTSRVAALEASSATSWSCSAQCGAYIDGLLEFRPISADGTTAGEALRSMQAGCRHHVFIGLANDSRRSLILATVQNACIKN